MKHIAVFLLALLVVGCSKEDQYSTAPPVVQSAQSAPVAAAPAVPASVGIDTGDVLLGAAVGYMVGKLRQQTSRTGASGDRAQDRDTGSSENSTPSNQSICFCTVGTDKDV